MTSIHDELRQSATRADELHRQSRAILVASIRKGLREGLSQREVAALVGRSQPEVSRLARFVPTSDHGRLLAGHRAEVLKIAKQHGASNVRVFGSTARGDDTSTSDIDLLVDLNPNVGLFQLARLEIAIADLLGVSVDVVPDSILNPFIASFVHDEAVAV